MFGCRSAGVASCVAQFGTNVPLAPVPPNTGGYSTTTPIITNQPVGPAPVYGPPAGMTIPAPPPAAYDPYNPPVGSGPILGAPGFGLPAVGLPSALAPNSEDAVCGAAGFIAYFEALWLDAYFPSTPYTQIVDDTNLFQTSQFAADYGSNVGYRIGVGWRFADGWDVGFAYTDFNTSGSASVGDVSPIGNRNPELSILDSNVFFLDNSDGGADDFLNLEADAARERLTLGFQVYDFEAGRKFCICRTLVLRPMAGIRFADFHYSRNTTYYDWIGANNVDTYSIAKSTSISGVGPRAGGLLAWNIGGSGFQVIGRGGVSLLVSDVTTRRSDTYFDDSANQTDSISNRNSFTQVIPVAELAVGLKYQIGRLTVSGGWEVQNWFNVVTDTRQHGFLDNNGVIQTPNSAGISQDRGDIALSGFFLRGGWNY